MIELTDLIVRLDDLERPSSLLEKALSKRFDLGDPENPPRFTESMDASISLLRHVLPGTGWSISGDMEDLEDRCFCRLFLPTSTPATVQHALAPVAVCIAICRVIEREEKVTGRSATMGSRQG